MNPRIIVIAGTSSNSGKTTLLCDLLRQLSGSEPSAASETWEAIKLTRGHYRSCGKDPEACCVSALLGEKPTVRSGRDATYTFGKDTARYWHAGAVNVHWVIAADTQVEAGIKEALAQVKTPNVLMEGTSLLQFVKADLVILVVGSDLSKPKASVRRALIEQKIHALYFPAENKSAAKSDELFAALLKISPAIDRHWLAGLPVFTSRDLSQLIELIQSNQPGNPEGYFVQMAAKRSESE